MRDSQLEKLRGLISGFSTVMLTTMAEPTGGHVPPMPVGRVDENTDLWLFTSRDSAKVLEIEVDARVGVHGQNGGTSCVVIAARATVVDDRAITHEIWKPSFKAWFPAGADDPNIVLLHVTGEQAEYWDNTGASSLRYVYQLLKPLETGTTPEINAGEQHANVELEAG